MFMPNRFDWGGLAAADKKANPWNYADDIDTTKQYMNSTNAFGISKADNPFSKGNIAGGIGAMANTGIGKGIVGAIGGIGNRLAYNGISGGLSSDAGAAVGNLTNTVGGAVAQVNPLLGAGIQVVGGAIGEGINALVGTSVDQEKKAVNDAGTAALNNYVSNATTLDDIKSTPTVANVQDAHRGGVFKKGWAREHNEADREARANALAWADRSREGNINNILADQLDDQLANYSAFGGTLDTMLNNGDMGVIEYDFLKDYLTEKRRQNDIKSKMSGVPAFLGGDAPSTFALGGVMQAHGGDYSTGLTHVNAGGSHELNPNEGVQMGVDREGTPNLVEEGETIYNDYVFSNRILADEATKQMFRLPKKKDITFADISKRLEKEIAERPSDPISKAGFEKQMQMLEEQQERQKQEMEAERARAAFEALSPEEQTALMQQRAEQEAMAQQQAMAEQQAAMQQPSQEEMLLAQQQQQMADGSEAAIGQEPEMNCLGGKINRFDEGGRAYTKMLNSLGFHTQKEFDDWAKENNIDLSKIWSSDDRTLSNDILSNLWKDENFKKALKAKNPALAHAFSEKGYDWGAYQPTGNGKATIQSISKGNWKTTNGKGWRGSDDLAFKQATEGLSDAEIDALTTEQLAERMRKTSAYQNTNKWLQNSDNALQYLNTLLNDPDTPEVAREYARKFVKDGKWKDGFNYDYTTVFGSNGKGVRETNPGTYWHTVLEANRGNQMKNLVQDANGNWEEIIGDIPADWTLSNTYSWATPESDVAYNYYTRPDAAVLTRAGEADKSPVGDSDGSRKSAGDTADTADSNGVKPRHKYSGWRYAGLFGPIAGLGMQALGIGKPDYSGLYDALTTSQGPVALSDYIPIHNQLRYRPMDIWAEQNRMDANSRATDKNIMNISGGNRGTAMAGIIANDYNGQIADGELFRKALEYNDAQRERVESFNRDTNKFNADAYNTTSRFNADALNRQKQYNSQIQLDIARQKMAADNDWYGSIYGNVAGLFRGLGDLGRENEQFNWLSDLAADGAFGNLGTSNTGRRWIKAKGGKIKKRGLTF